jgi:hypothetical protein
MIPVVVQPKTIIIVVPLTILVRGHCDELMESGISFQVYGKDEILLDRPPQIIFVSVEKAVTDHFQVLAKQLKNAEKLHSIGFDEIHLVLADYRSVMKSIRPLLCIDVPFFGLTGK